MGVLLVSEVAILLDNLIYTRKKTQARCRYFIQESLKYCKRFGISNHMNVVEELRCMLAGWRFSSGVSLTENEFGLLGTLVLSSSEEARTLATSLRRVPENELQVLLDKIKKTYMREFENADHRDSEEIRTLVPADVD